MRLDLFAKLNESKERKGKEADLLAPIVSISTTKCSDVYHTELPANTPHLPKTKTKYYSLVLNIKGLCATYLLISITLCLPAKYSDMRHIQ